MILVNIMSDINALKRRQMKKFIENLKEKRRRHTELISVYIPAGYDFIKVIQQLAQEQGTASNIKSASTRKNVQDALERMIQHLRVYKKTPEHGVAVFSGNVAEKEGTSDVQVYALEPPVPLNQRLYRCDKEFVTEPLEDMIEDKNVYGLVVMDRRDAIIAILKGKRIIPMLKTHSEVPGKFRAGGQSAQRFARLREGAAKDHYRKVGEYMKEQFLNMEGLKGIIVGGPGPTKNEFVEGNNITDQVKQKIIGIKDLSYTDEFGLQELVDRSQDLLSEEEIADEKKILNEFFNNLAKNPGKVAYGLKDVETQLSQGTVDTVIVSETADDDIIERIEKEAENYGSTLVIVSNETREGKQLQDIGKFAAILRFEVVEQ